MTKDLLEFKKKNRFQWKHTIYVIPLIFALFVVAVIAFPLIFIFLSVGQSQGVGFVVLIITGFIAAFMAVGAFVRLADLDLTRRQRFLWGVCFLLAPLLGSGYFLWRFRDRPPVF